MISIKPQQTSPRELVGSPFEYAIQFANDLAQKSWREGGDHPWHEARFTHPTKHAPNSFRYRVHADKNIATTNFQLPVYDRISKFNRPTTLSTSLIDQDQPGTYGAAGYILDFPAEAVLASTPVDANFYYSNFDSLKKIRDKMGVQAPEELLSYTGWEKINGTWQRLSSQYNEVIVCPLGIHQEHYPIKIIGMFVGKSAGDSPLIEAAEKMATKHGLPLVELPKPR